LFTDLESSARLWEQFPRAMRDALERHDGILRTAVEASNGQVVKTTGDGLMAVFASARDGVDACLSAQRGLANESWGETGALRVRMGLHAGVAETRAGDYFGPTVNRTARIMAAGHGGQVLLSAAAAALIVDERPEGATLRDLGEHRLKSLGRPERVFQLVHPDLVSDFPPLTTRSHQGDELPRQASAFVGRKAELEEIDRRFEDETVRLLTLVGPGGVGKTRLALRAATDQADRFQDGAFLVDLAAAEDAESVLTAIARAIGLSETSDEPMLEALTRQLHEQRALLILDNFEQVTVAATVMVRLLQGCPGLRLLVTSREALRVRDEYLIWVPPLELPPGGLKQPSAEQLGRFEAVQLFVERAQAAKPDFRLTDDNAPAVAEICLRLDGLPLAIELATARINLFSPDALRDRLGSRLQLLRSGARDLPARQQTLRATIEWSYRLLEPAEQRLFDVLSVFSGAGLDAVEVVVGGLDGTSEAAADPSTGWRPCSTRAWSGWRTLETATLAWSCWRRSGSTRRNVFTTCPKSAPPLVGHTRPISRTSRSGSGSISTARTVSPGWLRWLPTPRTSARPGATGSRRAISASSTSSSTASGCSTTHAAGTTPRSSSPRSCCAFCRRRRRPPSAPHRRSPCGPAWPGLCWS